MWGWWAAPAAASAYPDPMTYWWAVKEGLVYNVYNSSDSEVHSFPDQEKAIRWMAQRYVM